MKHVKKLNEIIARYDKDKEKFVFDPAEIDDTVSVYLHKDRNGFAMDIHKDDVSKLKEILDNNNITYTISAGNVLPF